MGFDIETIKRKMLVKYPFFGSIVANVNYEENTAIQTACTDGQTIYYNPDFLKKLKPEEQIFVFAHEVCHIAFDHIRRSDGKDPQVWNMATDGVINQFLKRDGLKFVEGCVDIEEAINYDAEQLYDKLLKEKQQNQGQNEQSSQQNQQDSSSSEQGQQSQEQSSSEDYQKQNENQSQGQGTSSSKSDSSEEQNHDVGHDTHSMWKNAVKRQKETESKDKKESQSDEQQTEKQKQQEEKLQQEIEKISKIGEQKAFNKNLEEKRKELEALKKALSQQAMGAGKSTSGEQRIIRDIGKSKPIIDWRYILRESIKYDVDWSYKNAYVEDGIVSASLEEQPMPETEIVLDTSGSINEILLKNFLRECKNILQYSKLKVGCFDTKFYGFHEIRTEEDIENMVFEGGGGTDFDVAVRAFTRRVENKIIFTDGDADMPNIPMDAIWIVFGGIEINPEGGRVIQINKEQLDRLYSFEQDTSCKGKRR